MGKGEKIAYSWTPIRVSSFLRLCVNAAMASRSEEGREGEALMVCRVDILYSHH